MLDQQRDQQFSPIWVSAGAFNHRRDSNPNLLIRNQLRGKPEPVVSGPLRGCM
jgi:hypothetical protein